MECISLCAWHILFLHFVSQCIHALAIPTWARFLFRNLFMEIYERSSHTHTCTHVHTHTYTHVHARTHTRTYTYTHTHMHIHVHTHARPHTHTHTCTYIVWSHSLPPPSCRLKDTLEAHLDYYSLPQLADLKHLPEDITIGQAVSMWKHIVVYQQRKKTNTSTQLY